MAGHNLSERDERETMAGYTQIIAENIKDLSGKPLNGRVTFMGPVNNGGQPVSALADGGPVMYGTASFLVAHGAIVGTPIAPTDPTQAVVADTLESNPANIGYAVAFYDAVKGLIARPGYTCVQPSGSTWSLDSFIPSQPALATVTSGPAGADGANGAPGAPGIASLPQLALVRNSTPAAASAPNLFNLATTSSGYIQHGTGDNAPNIGYYVSDYIVANSGGPMTANVPLFGNDGPTGDGIGFYDSNKAWISNDGNGYAAGAPFSVPATAAFVRVTVVTTYVPATVMLVNGATLPSAYVGFGYYPASTVDSKLAAMATTVFPHAGYLALQGAGPLPKNLFDYTQCVPGFVQGGTGAVGSNGGYLVSGFMPANAGGQMTANLPLFGNNGAAGDGIGYYDANKIWISNDGTGYAANTPFSVPANAYFVRVTTKQGTTDTTALMIVAGTTMPPAYVGAGVYPSTVVDAKLAALAASVTAPLAGFATSDAVTPDQAVTLVETASYIAARTLAPANYVMPTSTRSLYAYGDSLTAGLGANGVDNSTAFPAVMGPALGISTVHNYGFSTDEAPDTSLKIWSNAAPTPASALYTMMVGSTEALHQGTSYLAVHKAAHLANAAWLTSGPTACIDLTTVSATNWSTYTGLAATTGRQCATNGAAINFSVTTYGQPIYLFNLVQDGNAGTFSVSVDGGTALTVASSAGSTIATPNGATSFVQVTFIPAAAGTHTVTITQTSSSGSVVVMALGTALRHAYYGAVLLCGGMIPVEGDGIRLLDAQYTMNVIDNVRILQGYGADIRYVDTRSVIKAGNLGIYLAAANPHLTPAGYALLAQPFIQAAQRPPAPEVAKFTPASASSPATPGETWEDGNWRYRGSPSGTTTRTAATYGAW